MVLVVEIVAAIEDPVLDFVEEVNRKIRIARKRVAAASCGKVAIEVRILAEHLDELSARLNLALRVCVLVIEIIARDV